MEMGSGQWSVVSRKWMVDSEQWTMIVGNTEKNVSLSLTFGPLATDHRPLAVIRHPSFVIIHRFRFVFLQSR
jgi:hypothetical protein